MTQIAELTVHAFAQEKLRSGQPVLRDDRVPWCRPCRALRQTDVLSARS